MDRSSGPAKDSGAPVALPLLPDPDGSLGNWQFADTRTIGGLLPNHEYEIIWQVVNSGSPNAGNPGGFLAEIAPNPFIVFEQGSFLTTSSWQVAEVKDSLAAPSNFDSLSWTAANSYAANAGPGIWCDVKGGPVSGISGSAQWIWTAKNGGNSEAPDDNDSVFVKVEFRTVSVPEPSILLLLGSGLLVGLAGVMWKRHRQS